MRTYSLTRRRQVSAEEVARIKALSFGKSFLVDNNKFRVDGRSSSFTLREEKVRLQQMRKRQRRDGG
ncbi:MAG TPA: hypothetical protein V6D22_18725 [Candidatus Obscuribacterales bacterium]